MLSLPLRDINVGVGVPLHSEKKSSLRRYGSKLNQIKVYLSLAPNTTGVDLGVKCLLTGSNQ
jgi:hypothetical protein